MSMRMLRFLFATAGDAGWILLGLIAWAITLGAAEVTVGNAFTRQSFRFPGWGK